MLQDNTIRDLQMRIALSEDMKAYKELYLLMFDSLFQFSYSFVKSKQVAQELVSDVFMKLWQIRNQLNAIDNLKPYLFGITKNFSLKYLARASKNLSIQLDDIDPDEIDIESLIEFKNPEDLYISKETIKNVIQGIQNLPPQCQIIFSLVKVEGLKYKEVAKLLNISVFTVRNQVAIATKKIEDALPQKPQFHIPFRNKFSTS
ncbi:MAG: RNA polymerase sigma-70 factor [Chitinophagaceae bacterium]